MTLTSNVSCFIVRVALFWIIKFFVHVLQSKICYFTHPVAIYYAVRGSQISVVTKGRVMKESQALVGKSCYELEAFRCRAENSKIIFLRVIFRIISCILFSQFLISLPFALELTLKLLVK